MVDQSTTTMTTSEFLTLTETTEQIELLNGEVIVTPSPLYPHQRSVFKTAKVIESLAPNGEVIISPMDVVLDEHNVIQPDVFWIAEESQCILRDGLFYGPPDLIVEVLSPSTARRDKKSKFNTYEKFGVREYWLIDPVAEYLEMWTLKDKTYTRQGIYGPEDSFTSPVLEKEVKVNTII